MSKHTPGPWSVPHFADENSTCACSYVYSDSQRGFGAIATVQFGGEHESYETAKANANLIAAAPDLLDALEKVLAMGITFHSAIEENIDYDGIVDFEAWGKEARAAIAKSRGEA